MQFQQRIANDPAQPQKNRHTLLAKVILAMGGGLQIGLLKDVRGVDSPLQAGVHSKCDHSAQPLFVLCQQCTPGQHIAKSRAL